MCSVEERRQADARRRTRRIRTRYGQRRFLHRRSFGEIAARRLYSWFFALVCPRPTKYEQNSVVEVQRSERQNGLGHAGYNNQTVTLSFADVFCVVSFDANVHRSFTISCYSSTSVTFG
jgi:hypothetical protein